MVPNYFSAHSDCLTWDDCVIYKSCKTPLTLLVKVVSFFVLMTLSSIVSGWDRLMSLLEEEKAVGEVGEGDARVSH